MIIIGIGMRWEGVERRLPYPIGGRILSPIGTWGSSFYISNVSPRNVCRQRRGGLEDRVPRLEKDLPMMHHPEAPQS